MKIFVMIYIKTIISKIICKFIPYTHNRKILIYCSVISVMVHIYSFLFEYNFHMYEYEILLCLFYLYLGFLGLAYHLLIHMMFHFLFLFHYIPADRFRFIRKVFWAHWRYFTGFSISSSFIPLSDFPCPVHWKASA